MAGLNFPYDSESGGNGNVIGINGADEAKFVPSGTMPGLGRVYVKMNMIGFDKKVNDLCEKGWEVVGYEKGKLRERFAYTGHTIEDESIVLKNGKDTVGLENGDSIIIKSPSAPGNVEALYFQDCEW